MTHKRKLRGIAILITLAFLLSLLPAGMASAATTYSALSAPTVSADGSKHALGTVEIKFDTLAQDSSALISLPSNFDFNTLNTDTVIEWVWTPVDSSVVSVTPTKLSANEIKLDVDVAAGTGPELADDVKIVIKLNAITVPTSASGDIELKVDALSGQFIDGKVVVGVAGAGEVTASTGTPPTITSSGTSGGKIELTLKENAAGALKKDTKSVKFTLPYGFKWKDEGLKAITPLAGDVKASWDVDDSDPRQLFVTVSTESSVKSIIRINADILVDELKARFGDVDVSISGKSDVSPSSLVVAKYADFGVTVTAKDATEILTGRMEQEIGDIVLEEGAPESAINGRSVTLTLPKGAKWVRWSYKSEKGFDLSSIGVLDTDEGRTIKAVVYQTDSGTAGKLTLKDLFVDVAVDFSGPLEVEVGGTAGASGKVKVADVIAPVSLTATKTEVKIGLTDQAAGDLTITEAKAEALMAGKTLKIKTSDNNVKITDATVAVTEGDLVIGDEDEIEVGAGDNGNEIWIPIKGESRKASTIKITNLKYKVDRTVVEGDVQAKVFGDAVDEFADSAKVSAGWTVRTFVPEGAKQDYFDDFGSTAAKAVNATCVTPAPGEVKAKAVLTAGSTTMKVNDKEVSMDVAPYIKNDRLYVSARYCANALGVADQNIMWDGATRTATIIAGAKVIQMKVGSKTMVINGASITMDTAPEIVPPGRVMLPIGWLAWALGATPTWDQATQTATLEL